MEEEKKDEVTPERFISYHLKEKHVLLDTTTNTALIEQDTKEDLILAMVVDIKNSLSKLENNLI